MLSHEVFEEAVRLHGAQVLAYLMVQCRGQRPEAEDLLQRTFVDVWRARDQYDGRRLLPWLFGFARHRFLTERRAALRLRDARERLRVEPPPPSFEPADPLLELPLRGCLERLGALDRRLLTLAYGLHSPPDPPIVPHTDAEVAQVLSNERGTETADPARASAVPWRAERVKTRRHRALQALKRCLETQSHPDEARDPAPATSEKERSMPHPLATSAHPPLHRLQALAETFPPPPSADTLHLETCPHCQQELETLDQLEHTLLTPWRMQLEKASPPPEPLPADLLVRLLNIPLAELQDAAQKPTHQSLDTVPLTPANRVGPGRYSLRPLILIAAVFLATFGLWQAKHRAQLEPISVPEALPEDQARGDAENAPALPSPALEGVILLPGETTGQLLSSSPISAQRWKGEVPLNALIQLQISQPSPDEAWTAEVQCTWQGHGPIPLARDGATRLKVQGRSGDEVLRVGNPLALSALGVAPGDRLFCQATRVSETTNANAESSEALSLELEVTR